MDGDLTRPTIEFMQDVRSGAGCKGEWSARFPKRERQGLFDKKLPPWGRGGGFANNRSKLPSDPAILINRDPTSRKCYPDVPFGGCVSGVEARDPTGVAVWPTGKPDVQPRALSTSDAAKHGQDSPNTRQRPPCVHSFNSTRMGIRRGTCYVISEQHHEGLARWHP